MGPTEYFVNPKNTSAKMSKGTKYFARMGMGGNKSISCALGNNMAKPTKTPYKAPEAPTKTALNDA